MRMTAEGLLQDLRFALRQVSRSPGAAAVAVVSLALGIGATTAIFGLFDAVALRPLPVRDPQSLVELVAAYPDGRRESLPAEAFESLRTATDCFSDLIASQESLAPARVADATERLRVRYVSGNYFRALGVPAQVGRVVSDEDDSAAAPRVAVLSHGLWSRRYGGDPGIVGRAIAVGGSPARIVGVAQRDFFGLDRGAPPDLWMPLSADEKTSALWVVGRLRAGVSLAQARSRIQPLYVRAVAAAVERMSSGRWGAGWPEAERRRFSAQRVDLLPAGRGTVGLRWQLADPLRVLAAVVVLVLLIACINVSALLLARSDRRAGDVLVRLALGASRVRIVRHLLAESTLLSLLGGLAGMAAAFGLHRLLVTMLPLDPSAALEFHLNLNVLAFAMGLSVVAGVLAGLAPALLSTNRDLLAVLKARGSSGTLRRSRPMRWILVPQVAAVAVLLASAGLLLRSLSNLGHVDPGFEKERILTVQVNLPRERQTGREPQAVQDRLLDQVRALPGVESAALATHVVFGGSWIVDVTLEGPPGKSDDECHRVFLHEVGPGFFDALGLPLLAGRPIDARDGPAASPVALVNSAFAKKYFGGSDGIGWRLRGCAPGPSRNDEVVGLVADARTIDLRQEPEPAVYLALAQQAPTSSFALHVRTAGPASAWVAAVRSRLARVDPGLEIRVTTLAEQLGRTLGTERLVATLGTLFAAIALMLAGVGLYGTFAHQVTRRTNEIGVRLALGASRARVVSMVLIEALWTAGAGGALGLGAGVIAARSLRALLFGLSPFDPATWAGVAGILGAVALLAALLPARRAAGVEPMRALRWE